MSTLERLGSQVGPGPLGNLTEKQRIELGAKYDEASQIAALTGATSTAAYAEQLAGIQLNINSVVEAEKRGMLTKQESEKELKKLNKMYAEATRVASAFQFSGKLGATVVQAAHRAPSAAIDAIGDQVGGIATGLMSLATSVLPIGGGLFGLMMYGAVQRDRMNAEAGELTNIASAGGMQVSRSTLGQLAGFQETAQQFYGISRREIQGIAMSIVNAGLALEEITKVSRRGLGEVGSNAVTLTLALDTHFKLGGGYTAKGALDLVSKHGLSLKTSVDQMIKLEYSAAHAGTGLGSFTTFALQASDELRNYGVDAEQVGILLLNLQDRMKVVGLSAQAAASWAQTGASQVSQGIRGLSIGVRAYVGESLGYGEGLSASYGLQDKLMQGDPAQLSKIIQALGNLAQRETKDTGGSYGKDEYRQRAYLENLGMGFEGASAIVSLHGKLDLRTKLDEATVQEWKELKNSFTTEAQKLSQGMLAIRRITKGLAKIGEGMLQILVSFVGLAVVSIKAMLSIKWEQVVETVARTVVNHILEYVGVSYRWKAPETPESRDIQQHLNLYWNNASKAAAGVLEGVKEAGAGVSSLATPLIEPIIKALKFSTVSGTGIREEDGGEDTDQELEGYRILGYRPLQPKGSTLVKRDWKRMTESDLRNALRTKYKQTFGEIPSELALDILVAQAFHEFPSGFPNWNMAGIKGVGPSGLTQTLHTEEEVIDKETKRKVRIHVQDYFRAYKSLEEGMADYLRVLRHYPSAFEAMKRGDIAGFAAGLKRLGYYTASEEAYLIAMRKHMPTRKGVPPVAPPLPEIGGVRIDKIDAVIIKTSQGNVVSVDMNYNWEGAAGSALKGR